MSPYRARTRRIAGVAILMRISRQAGALEPFASDDQIVRQHEPRLQCDSRTWPAYHFVRERADGGDPDDCRWARRRDALCSASAASVSTRVGDHGRDPLGRRIDLIAVRLSVLISAIETSSERASGISGGLSHPLANLLRPPRDA